MKFSIYSAAVFLSMTLCHAIEQESSGEIGAGISVSSSDLEWTVGVAGALLEALATKPDTTRTTDITFNDPLDDGSSGSFDLNVFADVNAPGLHISATLAGTAAEAFKITGTGAGGILNSNTIQASTDVGHESADYGTYYRVEYGLYDENADNSSAEVIYSLNALVGLINSTGISQQELISSGKFNQYILITTDANSDNLLDLIKGLHPEFSNNITGEITATEMVNPAGFNINYVPLTATQITLEDITIAGDPDSTLGYALFDDTSPYVLEIEVTMVLQ